MSRKRENRPEYIFSRCYQIAFQTMYFHILVVTNLPIIKRRYVSWNKSLRFLIVGSWVHAHTSTEYNNIVFNYSLNILMDKRVK